jgi:putative ATP-binding cassette transporter
MMRLLREELPASAVVSIGHRPGLDRYHDRVLTLQASPDGAVLAEPERSRPWRPAPRRRPALAPAAPRAAAPAHATRAAQAPSRSAGAPARLSRRGAAP